ncbi:MAG: ABC transporter permease [Sulfolobales archaeon]
MSSWGTMRLFLRNSYGRLGTLLLAGLVVVAVVGPLLFPYGVWQYGVCKPFEQPSLTHPFGCDEIGRDLLTLFLSGARMSLFIGFVAAFLSTLLGALVGLVGGYFGGPLDVVLMRVVDALLAIPTLVLMIIFAAVLGSGISNVIFVISVLSWPPVARVVRSQTLSVKEYPHVEAARACGASSLRILFKHIAPATTPLVVANMILQISNAIIAEAALSFLGLGDPRIPSWGGILRFAFRIGAMSAGYWWYVVPPGLGIVLAVLSVTFISYALDEIVNPRLRKY